MPACLARYDVIFNDGTGQAVGHTGRNRLTVDMEEDREPDEFGEPGRLLGARLLAWSSPYVRVVEYAPAGRQRALWVDGSPRRVKASRRFIRWAHDQAETADAWPGAE